jgi:hypothetical protein
MSSAAVTWAPARTSPHGRAVTGTEWAALLPAGAIHGVLAFCEPEPPQELNTGGLPKGHKPNTALRMVYQQRTGRFAGRTGVMIAHFPWDTTIL